MTETRRHRGCFSSRSAFWPAQNAVEIGVHEIDPRERRPKGPVPRKPVIGER